MELTVSVITQPYKRTSYKLRYFLLLFLAITVLSNFAIAQKKSKGKVVEISAENREKLDTYFFEGIRQKNIDNNDAAIRSFLKVVEIDPSNDAAHYELGLLYTKQKNFNAAAVSFQKAVDNNPTNEWYLLNNANAQENIGDYKKAEKLYSDIIKMFPEKVETYFDLASVKIYQNDFKGAIKVYSIIESKIGINEDVSMQRQKIWLKLGKVDKAAEVAQQLVDVQPTEMRYRINLAEVYMSNKQSAKGLRVLTDILAIEPNNGYAQLAIADFYREQKDDESSYRYLKLAFANPTVNIDQKIRILSPYFSALSIASIKERAFELTRLCITAHPMEAKAFAIYGDFLYQDKQLDSAMSAYQTTIRLDKKVFAVWQNLMFIEIELLDYTALLKTSDDAIQLFPAQQIVHYLNAVAKAQKKDYDGALVAYQNALTLSVNNPETEAQIHAGMGDAYHSLKKHTESDESYDKALSIRPDDPFVLNNFAYYLSLRNINLEKALSMSKKSNDLMKNNASFLDTYAWILFRLARYDDALIWIDKAITAGGLKSATVIEHRGDVLIKLNRTEEAIEEWNKASKMSDQSELLKKKINTKQYHDQ